MSVKIFVIKRSDGRFYNHDEKWFASKLSLGTFASSKSKFLPYMDFDIFKDCEIFETTEEEWTRDMASITTSAILKLESAKKDLEDVKYSLPTMSKLNKSIGVSINNCIFNLSKISPMHKKFIEEKENDTDDVTAVYNEYIEQVSTTEMWECSEVSAIIEAYRKDRKSILGIVRKILNN
jgi:hypothetical protein